MQKITKQKSAVTRRKILSLLLSLAMILTALPLAGVTAFAEDEAVTLTANKYYAKIGDTITVYLDVENLSGILATISFDTGSFEFVSAIPGDAMTAVINTNDAYNGSIKIAAASPYVVTGTIVEIQLKYIGGKGVITADFEKVVNYNDKEIPLDPVSITIDGFYYSSDFEYVILEDGSAEITDYTGSAEALEIPSTLDGYAVTSIGEEAFYACDSLTSVTIGNGVTSIGDYAFRYCYSLTEINVDVSNKNYSSQDGVLFNKNKTELIQYPIGNTRTSYKIPNTVTSIGDWAFYGCDSLTSVTIPNSVTSIGNSAFYWCEGLTNITIPESVTSIGDNAFGDCKSLTEINVDANNKNYSSQDGVLFDKNKTVLIQYPIGNTRTSYDIPNSVTSIGDSAFEGCGSLSNIKIGNSVTSIGGLAFLMCDSLTSVTISEGVTSIGLGAFGNCGSLTSVKIPDSVTSIGEIAFWYCHGLTNVTIPESVTAIGSAAFSMCDNLTDIYILNRECNIEDDYHNDDTCTIEAHTTIHGYTGSTAESYAKEHGNKFVALDEHPGIEKVPAKAATCTEDGNIEYFHCSDCNKNFNDKYGLEEISDVVVKATGHNMEQVPEKAATCTEDGNIKYYHCSDCNKNFKDKDGKEEVTDVVVKATGHNYENGVCTVCGEKDPNASKPSGEVSGDGKLSTVDAKWILQNIAKSRDFSDEQSKAADLNGDGKLSVVDVKWVLQIVAGMRDAETLELITK